MRRFWFEWRNVEYILFTIYQEGTVLHFGNAYYYGQKELLLEETYFVGADNYVQFRKYNDTHWDKFAFPFRMTKFGVKIHNILHQTNKGIK